MLQIIGWMGCLYLIVKALELLSSNEHQTDGKFHGTAQVGAVIAIVSAIGFFFLLDAQVDATTAITSDFAGLAGEQGYAGAPDDAGEAAESAMAEAEANIEAAAADADAAAAEAEAEAHAAIEESGYAD
jgi:hypothetical protein